VGVEIDRRRIVLDEPIKRIGTFDVSYRIISGVEAIVKVTVTAAGEDA
jgi:large subunit ribosomal protein L9